MKQSLAMIFFMLCFSLVTHAQDSNTMYLKTDTSARMQIKDHFLYRNGHVLKYKNGDSAVLGTSIVLGNGSTLDPVGMLTNNKKKSRQLKEGEMLDVDGNLISQDQMPKKNP